MSLKSLQDFLSRDDGEALSGYPDEYLVADWTLVQALTWATHRTPEWARRLAPFYLRFKSHTPMAQVDLADARALLILHKWPGDHSGPEEAEAQAAFIDPPWNKLWLALSTGDLKATGIPVGQNQRQPIPSEFWQDADRLGAHDGPRDAVSVLNSKWINEISYFSVRVRRADVVICWPAIIEQGPVKILRFEPKEKRNPGPKPTKTKRILEQMRNDLASKKFSRDELKVMTHAALGSEYQASPNHAAAIRQKLFATL